MKRSLYDELMAGVNDMESERAGRKRMRRMVVSTDAPSAKERVKLVEQAEGITREQLAVLAGMTYTRLKNLVGGQTKFRLDDIEHIAAVFPQYEYWLYTGKVLPESGQVSPALDADE